MARGSMRLALLVHRGCLGEPSWPSQRGAWGLSLACELTTSEVEEVAAAIARQPSNSINTPTAGVCRDLFFVRQMALPSHIAVIPVEMPAINRQKASHSGYAMLLVFSSVETPRRK